MIIFIFYTCAFLSLAVGTAAIYMSLIETFPTKWVYYHYFIRKYITWSILCIVIVWTSANTYSTNHFPLYSIAPLLICALGVVLSYKMHQERLFQAVDFPPMSDDITKLPIKDDMELAIIQYDGVTKCYPLDYVIHHHIINDRFNTKIVSLTYCAMCRSIIPFDVTDIGPLFVASFKNANMIVADRNTKTFFQQATFESVIGKLHPYELEMISFQILAWKEIKKLHPIPQVVFVSKDDFKQFELPIPGIWNKIVNSELTPGLWSKNRDKTFPTRTRVIGIIDPDINEQVVYLKKEILSTNITINHENKFVLISIDKSVNGFKTILDNHDLNLNVQNNKIVDKTTNTQWDIRGKYLMGEIKKDLITIAISDEYWFSWKKYHPKSTLFRI